jgi:hypothetical protein
MYFRSFRARSATEVNTPRDNVALDLGKPQFHLIEPGRIRGREMEADSGMLLQKLLHRFGFVGGEIVQHDVNLSCPARFPQQPPQKHQELSAGISLRSVALHPAGLHVQGGIQRQSSVPVVLETVPFGSPRRQRTGSSRSSFGTRIQDSFGQVFVLSITLFGVQETSADQGVLPDRRSALIGQCLHRGKRD